jgi:hypothetical protein
MQDYFALYSVEVHALHLLGKRQLCSMGRGQDQTSPGRYQSQVVCPATHPGVVPEEEYVCPGQLVRHLIYHYRPPLPQRLEVLAPQRCATAYDEYLLVEEQRLRPPEVQHNN